MSESVEQHERNQKAQEIFFSLTPEAKADAIKHAHEQANALATLVNTGKAKNYSEAAQMMLPDVPDYDPPLTINLETIDHGSVVVKSKPNGDFFLYIENREPELLGNALEGVYSEAAGILCVDVQRLDNNLDKIFSKLHVFKRAEGTA